jgi:hypothetical protein
MEPTIIFLFVRKDVFSDQERILCRKSDFRLALFYGTTCERSSLTTSAPSCVPGRARGLTSLSPSPPSGHAIDGSRGRFFEVRSRIFQSRNAKHFLSSSAFATFAHRGAGRFRLAARGLGSRAAWRHCTARLKTHGPIFPRSRHNIRHPAECSSELDFTAMQRLRSAKRKRA